MGYFVKNRQLQSGSTGVVLPSGSSAERPNDPLPGMMRYNTDLTAIEYFNGISFVTLTAAGSVTYVNDEFTGDGVTTIFAMSQPESSASQLIVFVGSIYQIPTTNYTVDGSFNITFTSAPPLGVTINVIHSST